MQLNRHEMSPRGNAWWLWPVCVLGLLLGVGGQVRAAEETITQAPEGFVEQYCLGECCNPSDERLRIERIEVVRIRPQISADEPLEGLIEDPWKVLPCPRDVTTCHVTFEDPDFAASSRPVLYYVRALQEKTPSLNAGNLRCTYDAQGNCVEIHPCYSDYRGKDDECLTLASERAWSSPIFLDLMLAAQAHTTQAQ